MISVFLKGRPYPAVSSNQIGRLVFSQVLHRGENTAIQYKQGRVEIVNALFQDGLKIDLGTPDVPLHLYGAFLRKGLLSMNLDETQVFWDYIPDLQAADPSILFNPDLFLFPGDIKVTSIEDIEDIRNRRVKMYPNPTTEFLHVEWEQGDKVLIRIYDVRGRMVYSAGKLSNKISIPSDLLIPSQGIS